MRMYRVQITEGHPNEFLWGGSAKGDDHAVARATEAFERAHQRAPDHALVTVEQASIPPSTFLSRAALERVKSEFAGARTMRHRLADEHRLDGDVKDIETPSQREQREEARVDQLLSQAPR